MNSNSILDRHVLDEIWYYKDNTHQYKLLYVWYMFKFNFQCNHNYIYIVKTLRQYKYNYFMLKENTRYKLIS